MITIVQGPPGSGKTYWAVRYLISCLIRGDYVYTNIPICKPEIFKKIHQTTALVIDEKQVIEIGENQIRQLNAIVSHGEGVNVQVIIDESQFQLNARDFAQQARELMNWASVSRHYRADLVFITQHRHNIDAQFRRLANQYLFLKDFQAFKFGGISFGLFPYFRVTVTDVDESTITAREWIRKDKGLYRCYDSYSLAVGTNANLLTKAGLFLDKKKLNRIGCAA